MRFIITRIEFQIIMKYLTMTQYFSTMKYLDRFSVIDYAT